MNVQIFYYIDQFVAFDKTKSSRFSSRKSLLNLHSVKTALDKMDNRKFNQSKQIDSFICDVICLLVMENIAKGNLRVDFNDSTLVAHRKLLNERLLSKAKNP